MSDLDFLGVQHVRERSFLFLFFCLGFPRFSRLINRVLGLEMCIVRLHGKNVCIGYADLIFATSLQWCSFLYKFDGKELVLNINENYLSSILFFQMQHNKIHTWESVYSLF